MSGQYPIGITTGAPVVIEAARQNKAHVTDLLAMLKRTTHHLASVALLDVDAEVKRTALAMVTEARALVRRIEGTR